MKHYHSKLDTSSYKNTNSYHNKQLKKIADILLKSNGNCKIFGSYIYKGVVRGETPNDIDCVCENTQAAINDLKQLGGTEVDFAAYADHDYSILPDYRRIQIKSSGINVDIHPKITNNIIFTSIPVLTRNGLENAFGSSEFKNRQLKFVISNLERDRYCQWDNMRDKDKEYFKNFSAIDKDFCDIFM